MGKVYKTSPFAPKRTYRFAENRINKGLEARVGFEPLRPIDNA
jgi:hypothetical protein